MRGIGPCYRDKADRNLAIRLGDLYRPAFKSQVERIVAYKNIVLGALAGGRPFEPLCPDKICAEYLGYARQLERHVADTTSLLLAAVEADRPVLFEGAQGSLLDLDHGTFPFVTSSNSSAVGIASGSGIPPGFLKKIVGIVKAYSTRVGGGPFPTEETGDIGQHIRDRGHEYGTVTGRPRRCGWFDGVAARYTARLGGIAGLSVMLLDVLDELPELKICVAYEINGKRTTEFPSHVDDLRLAKPVYETLPGWKQDISKIRKMADLPPAARGYLKRISELLGRPVEIVSVGPDREQTILA
jgi:adenylosuccinate synthase